MSTHLNDLSIEELEKLLAEKRARQRFSTRMESQTSAMERGAQKLKAAGTARPDINFMRVGNRLLLAVEVFAVAGLLIAGLAIFFRLQELNRESAAAQSGSGQVRTGSPEAAATLPGASQPPSAGTPERFKGVLKQVVPVAIPTPGPQQPVRIVIPAINVDSLVVEGDDWEALKKGAGHRAGSTNPGQRGNMVISGHDDVFGEVFRYIGDLKAGDEVQVYSKEAKFTYVVRNRRIVEPTDVSVLQATTEPTLTLITCYPYLIDNQRMIVFAQLAK
ncbi:MAG: class D sortase [Chloroflexi bacterium]|nr:class D sortase [Chloroflexota bacterium]